ncbi:hypothetical protein EMCRGX_G030672 [Ephydatia muelleri]|eukprot:Em0010g908a
MAVAKRLGRLTADCCYFFLCDVQDKFRPSIRYFPEIIAVAKRMVDAANILEIPVIATEQYPKGLGSTVAEIDTGKAKVFDKTVFSMLIPPVEKILDDNAHRKSVVLFGIETQVCVQQTTLDLLGRGYDVHIVADGVSSRSQVDRMFALERMRQAGAFISTSESILFELLHDSKHPKFKEVQAIIKNPAPDSGLLTKL